jgi:arylsulfatase A
MTRLSPVLLPIILLCISAIARADKPNIVFILADDMGYGDVQIQNPKSTIPTPNLDALASSGMTFTDAHSGSAVCTPTRYGFVTGRYCFRSRLKRGVQNGYGGVLIEKSRSTIASFLKSQGYATGIVGKWHLGLGFAKDGKKIDYTKPVDGAQNLGFEYSYIIPASLDFPPYVYIEDGMVTAEPTLTQPGQKFPAFLRQGPRSPDFVMEDCLDHLTAKAAGYIKGHAKKDKPFFLYFPLTAPHKPAWPHKRFVGKTKLGPYGDFVTQVDWTVGQVIKAIDDAGIKDNTLIIYSSDNGSYMHRYDEAGKADHVSDSSIQAYNSKNHTANGVLRGTKADVWEAGHRVPFFVRWPAKVKAASKSDKTICLTDVFASAADIIGAKVPKGAAADSYSFYASLQGKAAAKRPPVIHHSAAGMFAIRQGKWKLVLGNGSGGRQNPRGKAFVKPYALFDMSADISETKNLAKDHPDIAARLEKAALQIRDNEAGQ